MASLGVAEEPVSGCTEKKDLKTAVEKMELTRISATQADWQFTGISARTPSDRPDSLSLFLKVKSKLLVVFASF